MPDWSKIASPLALGLLVLLALILLALPQGLAGRPFELRILVLIFLFATLGHGWNILGGYAGQSSIGHGMFFGLGAYATTILSLKWGINPWFGALAGMVVAGAAGVLLGIPCFRLRGHYFVIATLVLAESLFQLFTAWEWVGAAMGLELPVRSEGLASFQFHRNKIPYYYIALAMLVAVTGFIWWLHRSRIGLILRAIRDDEEAARSLGFSARNHKLLAMAFSASIVGMGGAFYAQYVLFIDPFNAMALHTSVMIALIPILGGVGTIAGPIIGAAILIPLSEYSRVYFSGSGRNVDLLIYGLLIMLISVYRPDGIIGLLNSPGILRFLRQVGLHRPSFRPARSK